MIQRYQCRIECQQQFKSPYTHCSFKIGILGFVGHFCKSCRRFLVKVGVLRKQVILLLQILCSGAKCEIILGLQPGHIYLFSFWSCFCIWGFWITFRTVLLYFQKWCKVCAKNLVCKEVVCQFEYYSHPAASILCFCPDFDAYDTCIQAELSVNLDLKDRCHRRKDSGSVFPLLTPIGWFGGRTQRKL